MSGPKQAVREPAREPVREPSRGLGDTIARITKRLGIEPCEPCEARRRALNERFPYRQRTKP